MIKYVRLEVGLVFLEAWTYFEEEAKTRKFFSLQYLIQEDGQNDLKKSINN